MRALDLTRWKGAVDGRPMTLSEDLKPYFCAKPGGFYSIVQTEGISILQREQICPDFDIIGKLL